MAHKRGVIQRSTEDNAIDPTLINRSPKSFVAPYGSVSREITSRVSDEDKAMRRLGAEREAEQKFGWLNKYAPPKEETPPKEEADSDIISQAGIIKNERHTRMMERDYIFPHERRFLAEDWSETEASDYQEQVIAHNIQKDTRLSGIMADQMFGWLNKYAGGVAPHVELPEFETLNLDDPEVIPESTSNQNSPIFTSTGRTFNTSRSHSASIVVPLGDNGMRKELPTWAYLSPADNEFTTVHVAIPEYVPRQEWLNYCLKKII